MITYVGTAGAMSDWADDDILTGVLFLSSNPGFSSEEPTLRRVVIFCLIFNKVRSITWMKVINHAKGG